MARRRGVLYLLVALLAALLHPGPATAAEAQTTEDRWYGTLRTTVLREMVADPATPPWQLQEQATYDLRAPVGHRYAADISLNGSLVQYSACTTRHEWSGSMHRSAAISLRTDAAGQVWFNPIPSMNRPVEPGDSGVVPVTQRCGDEVTSQEWWAILGFHILTAQPELALLDDRDPSPDRLVGEMRWGAVDELWPPTMRDDLADYEYVVNYDLSRQPPGDCVLAPGDGPLDPALVRDEHVVTGLGASRSVDLLGGVDWPGLRVTSVSALPGESGLIDDRTLRWTLPEAGPPSDDGVVRPLLGKHEVEFNVTDDADCWTARGRVTIVLYDCYTPRHHVRLQGAGGSWASGEFRFGFEPRVCFDGTNVWVDESLGAYDQAYTRSGPSVLQLPGFTSGWDLAAVDHHSGRDLLLTATSQAHDCLALTDVVGLHKRLTKGTVAAWLARVYGGRVRAELLQFDDEIMRAIEAEAPSVCFEFAEASLGGYFRPTGDYTLTLRLRPLPSGAPGRYVESAQAGVDPTPTESGSVPTSAGVQHGWVPGTPTKWGYDCSAYAGCELILLEPDAG